MEDEKNVTKMLAECASEIKIELRENKNLEPEKKKYLREVYDRIILTIIALS